MGAGPEASCWSATRTIITPGVPYLDKITFEFGQDPTVAVLRLKKGEVDIVGDGIPPAQFAEVMGDPANKDLIAEGDQLHTGYVTMNVNMPPFDNLKVRQAVNMAINKERIVRIINNRARAGKPGPAARRCRAMTRTTRAIPTIRTGPRSCWPKLALADGFSTELYTMNVDPNPRIAQAIQQDLAAVGIKAEIRSLAQAEVIAAGGSGKAPMIWSGGMAWIADFPDPSNFYYGILGCAGAVEGGWNWSRYCNKALDDRADQGRRHGEGRPDEGPHGGLERHLRRRDEGCALGADLQREALHLSFGPAGRRSRLSIPIRSIFR